MANIKELLLQLKDLAHCNDNLALTIRQTVLEPFQLDLSKVDAVRKPPPTPARFKQMATQLAPFAMRIVNQNIESLASLKGTTSKSKQYVITVNCLVDTSFYALSALRHMNTHTTLKPLDIEKTTSNLIGKMVDIGEYNRALDELRKFRSVLASVAKVQLDSKLTVDNKSKTIPKKRVLAETQDNNQSTYKRSFSPVPDSMIGNQWEQEMLYKYQDLFQFPYDTSINDRTMVLLVLAYQMNALRCWCEVGDNALAKYVPYFMEKSGNFIDWSKHLYKIDAETAKKQLDSFQRLLYKAANKYPLTGIFRGRNIDAHTRTYPVYTLI
ncbi:uncharacterized protein EV154DRAFT_430519 [Mucor mucedo]|uniref:uncharacterized protein n=1 Tax=Mucor mucedo TaxID=29922 RepID=UPI0022201AD0|nr:uncharacterized protein EV154DRAFT_430519 [Mucor mucedo]KAI7873953.1 hypothetical protein EV154DRAFT_430519 [Mucor mucedo]